MSGSESTSTKQPENYEQKLDTSTEQIVTQYSHDCMEAASNVYVPLSLDKFISLAEKIESFCLNKEDAKAFEKLSADLMLCLQASSGSPIKLILGSLFWNLEKEFSRLHCKSPDTALK